jgi:N-acetylglucosamine repressor
LSNTLTQPIEMAVVHQLRLGEGLSRVDLARQLAIAPSTIGVHVDRLLRRGYLRESKAEEHATGRTPTALHLAPEAGQFIGVDLDARQILARSFDFAQQPIWDCTMKLRSTDSAEIATTKIKEVMQEVQDPARPLLGIGVAVPGAVDTDRGLALHYRYIRGWNEIPLSEILRQRFNAPVQLENNIRAMALAERWFGDGRNVDDFVCIGIRSGIGSGLFLNGRLYRGSHQFAGEIGSWPQDLSTTTLEDTASLRAILLQLTSAIRSGASSSIKVTRNTVTLPALILAIKQNDALALEVLKRAALAIASALVPITLLLNPTKIIVAGPLAEMGEAFTKPLVTAMKNHLPASHTTIPEIAMSKLGDFAGVLGAAALAVNQWQPES